MEKRASCFFCYESGRGLPVAGSVGATMHLEEIVIGRVCSFGYLKLRIHTKCRFYFV